MTAQLWRGVMTRRAPPRARLAILAALLTLARVQSVRAQPRWEAAPRSSVAEGASRRDHGRSGSSSVGPRAAAGPARATTATATTATTTEAAAQSTLDPAAEEEDGGDARVGDASRARQGPAAVVPRPFASADAQTSATTTTKTATTTTNAARRGETAGKNRREGDERAAATGHPKRLGTVGRARTTRWFSSTAPFPACRRGRTR